jgi:hypothetical protein
VIILKEITIKGIIMPLKLLLYAPKYKELYLGAFFYYDQGDEKIGNRKKI